MDHPVVTVFLLGLVTALATGLGAIPFAFVRRVSAGAVAKSNAIASGLMLGASVGLLLEGSHLGMWQTLVGATVGVGFVVAAERGLADRDVEFGQISGAGAKDVLLLVGVMTVHSLAEGVAVGVSFGGGPRLATAITVAIAIHNIPEGVAISAVMRPKGASILSCAKWSIFSSLPQPLMAVPAFLFVEAFRPVLPYGLGFAAGAMAFMVFLELLPEAYRDGEKTQIGLIVSVSLGAMVLFQHALSG